MTMPDLGSLSLSAALTLSHCPNGAAAHQSSHHQTNSLHSSPLKTPTPPPNAAISEPSLLLPANHHSADQIQNKIEVVNEIEVSSTKAATGNEVLGLEDRVKVKDCSHNSEDFKASFSLPFLVGAPKMAECLVCRHFVNPGEELSCSVRGCDGVYHIECAKQSAGVSNIKKFKCPQHVCFVCKQKLQLRCARCTLAFHHKCAPWPDAVVSLRDHPGHAICWRHPSDWRLDRKPEVSTSDIKEVFSQLPLPYVIEEFKIDLTWKDMEIKMEPPPYIHIRRNVYLVRRRPSDLDDGCCSCSSTSTCSDDCMCRVQSISCSKSCRCSENCNNRPFRKEKKIKIVKTELCGWGVEASETINKGEFIVEYVGEVIDDALCEQRLWDMKYSGVQNFYMCEIRKDFTIDATFKGNMSRFLNHSCDPNCVLEKWQVDGETRVGVFAARSIEVGEPLTYDYRFVQFGPEVRCHCGAPNCQGFLGTKRKIEKVDLCWGTKRRRTSTADVVIVAAPA